MDDMKRNISTERVAERVVFMIAEIRSAQTRVVNEWRDDEVEYETTVVFDNGEVRTFTTFEQFDESGELIGADVENVGENR
jgi:hypothetical protein